MRVRELYEEFPFPLKGNYYDFLARYVFPHAPLRPTRVLDAGCGTGNMTVELAQRFPSAQVVGVDFSERSLAEARLRAQERRLYNIDFRHQDLMDEFPPDETQEGYDFAVSIGCLHHIPDPAIALRHIHSALSREAVLIIGVYGKYGRIETEMRRQLVGLLREVTKRSTSELIPLCNSVLSEPPLRENTFYKVNEFLMPLKDPRRFVSLVKRFLLGKIGVGRLSARVPLNISRADQYMHPLVLSWTAGEWLRTIEAAGYEVKHFIYEPASAGMCVPWNAMGRIRDRDLRLLLEGMSPNACYEALDLIFRPSMHLIACKPVL